MCHCAFLLILGLVLWLKKKWLAKIYLYVRGSGRGDLRTCNRCCRYCAYKCLQICFGLLSGSVKAGHELRISCSTGPYWQLHTLMMLPLTSWRCMVVMDNSAVVFIGCMDRRVQDHSKENSNKKTIEVKSNNVCLPTHPFLFFLSVLVNVWLIGLDWCVVVAKVTLLPCALNWLHFLSSDCPR